MDVVVWPDRTAEVSQIAQIATAHQIPLTAWGAGTGLEGQAIPLKQGISLNFQRMNRVLAVHDEDFQVTVQPGILRKQLEADLARYRLMFAPDPGANATLGGMIANNAAETRTVKYGAALKALTSFSQLKRGDSVLINGASGGVGTMGIQLVKAFGG